MAKYQLDERGKMECPKTGKAVNPYKHCQAIKCDHYGFWHNEQCFVCRYTKERELRLRGADKCSATFRGVEAARTIRG